MSPDLDTQLCEKYPKIFSNRYKAKEESCMAWGLEVGDGWYDLLDTLCTALSCIYTTSISIREDDGIRLGIEPSIWSDNGKRNYYFQVQPPTVVATQIKEKFGTLRFYYRLEYSEQNHGLVETGNYPELVRLNEEYRHHIDGIVHFAEVASALTCSVSGAKGQMHVRHGWFKTLCSEVAAREPYLGYVPYDPVRDDPVKTRSSE